MNKIQLINGEIMDMLAALPDHSVAMTLIPDLPHDHLPFLKDLDEVDSELPFETLMKELVRITTPHGIIAIVSKETATAFTINKAVDLFRYSWIYERNPQPRSKHEHPYFYSMNTPMPVTEHINIFSERRPRYYGNPKLDTNVLRSRHKPDRHESMPLDILEYLINIYTVHGETVLDPFAGLTETMKACCHMGRSFLGLYDHDTLFQLAKTNAEREARENPDYVTDWKEDIVPDCELD